MAILYDAVIPPAELTAFARAVPFEQNYVLNQILPDRVDALLEVEVSAELTSTTRAAKARAWDAPPLPGRRDRLETRNVQLPAISQFLDRGERDRLEMERLRTGGNSTAAIERAIFNDTVNNVRSVQARVELMRGDVLADGIVTIPELGGLTADYGVPAAHKVTAATMFSDHNAPVLDQYRAWAEVYENGPDGNGFRFGGQWMSRQVLSHLLQNDEIRDLCATFGGSPNIVTRDQLNQVMDAFDFPAVAGVYDAKVEVDGQTVNILPPDRIIFTPPAGIPLGYTQWGMTATALELQNSNVRVDPTPAGMVAVVDKSVTPPYREAAYVDATCLPVLERPRGLFVAKVLA